MSLGFHHVVDFMNTFWTKIKTVLKNEETSAGKTSKLYCNKELIISTHSLKVLSKLQLKFLSDLKKKTSLLGKENCDLQLAQTYS